MNTHNACITCTRDGACTLQARCMVEDCDNVIYHEKKSLCQNKSQKTYKYTFEITDKKSYQTTQSWEEVLKELRHGKVKLLKCEEVQDGNS